MIYEKVKISTKEARAFIARAYSPTCPMLDSNKDDGAPSEKKKMTPPREGLVPLSGTSIPHGGPITTIGRLWLTKVKTNLQKILNYKK
jgi:hypothetical protein